MARKKQEKFTAAEKKAFKRGMAAQYNKEHPKFNYAVATKKTYFDADGSVKDGFYGRVSFYKTELEAKEAVKKARVSEELRNAPVIEAVKKKKVNIYDTTESSIEQTVYKRIKPTRDIGYIEYKNLK